MSWEDFLTQWQSTNKDYILAHTSGSTGAPKEIHLKKSDMAVSARATNRFFDINSDSLLVCPLSLDYIAGKMIAVRALEAGCRVIFLPPSNNVLEGLDWPEVERKYSTTSQGTTSDGEKEVNANLVEPGQFEVNREGGVRQQNLVIDLLPIVPSQADFLIANPQWAKRIRNLLVGGGQLSPQRARALLDAGYKGYTSYGMTETCSHVALAPIGSDLYEAMDTVWFGLEDGCLRINSDLFSWGQLQTRDVCALEDERHFRWIGRRDNVINTGGIKVYPEDLEKRLSSQIQYPFYIIGVEDPKWGQRIEMRVEALVDEAQAKKIESAIILLCRKALKRHEVPKSVKVVPHFERTSSGKIIRK